MDVLRIDESSNGRRVVLTYTSRGFTNYAFVVMVGNFSLRGFYMQHPWAGEDLSLKIDEHDQTIWNCILEL